MRWKSKCCKKFLSCLLAASMVVTGGGVYGATAVQAEAAESETYYMLNVDGSMWRIYNNGIVSDESTGLKYALNNDDTASLCGYLAAAGLPAKITVPDTIALTYSVYEEYWNNAADMGYASGASAGSVNFTELTTVSSVIKIADKVFEGAASLEEVELGSNITAIGDHAFANCSNLTKLTVPDSVTQFGLDILTGAANCTVYCSAGSKAAQYAQENGYTYNTGESPEETPSPSVSPEASESPEPETSESPEVSASPSAEPDSTTVPTEAPANTAVPTVTPEASSNPDDTTAPTVTPETSSNPDNTTAPTETPNIVPEPSKAPTVAPTVTAVPSPGTTATIAPTLTPDEAGTMAPTRVPQATGTPMPVATPQATGTALPTMPPVPSTTPQVTGTATPAPLPSAAASPSVTATPVSPETPAEDDRIVTKNNVRLEVNTNNNKVSVCNMGNVKASNVTIPATVTVDGKKYSVTKIESGAFKGNTSIKTITLGKNITTIEAGAFQECTKLTTVTFSSKVKTIGKNSFYGCKSLKKVTLPDSVTSIKKAAFKNCTSLKKITIGTNSNTKKGAMVIDGKKVMYGAGTVKIDIGAQALANCKNLTSLTINRMVTRIGNSAFKGCTSLSDIIVRSLQLQRVDKGALTGVSNCKISVPTKKVKPYTALFKNKGQGKKVVVAKI